MDDYSKLDQSETGFCENTFRGRSGLCTKEEMLSNAKITENRTAECSTSRQASPGRLFVIMIYEYVHFFFLPLVGSSR